VSTGAAIGNFENGKSEITKSNRRLNRTKLMNTVNASTTDSMDGWHPTNTRCAWAKGALFSSCAVVSVFWFLVGNRFWCYLLTYLEYNTVVVLC
jgi:hypothetical protein